MKALLFFTGLPGMGKSEVAKSVGSVCEPRGIFYIVANPGHYRRQHCSWLRSAEDFAAHPEKLDEISRRCLEEGISSLYSFPNTAVCAFDQTGTRRSSREQVWSLVQDRSDLQLLILEIIASNIGELKDSFIKKATNGDYGGVNLDDATRDFEKRHRIYQERASRYVDDDFFMTHRPSHIVFDRSTGAVQVGNGGNVNQTLLEVALAGITNVNCKFGKSTPITYEKVPVADRAAVR